MTPEYARELVISFRKSMERRWGVALREESPGASVAEVAAAEREVGSTLPDDLRALFEFSRDIHTLAGFHFAGLVGSPTGLARATAGLRFIRNECSDVFGEADGVWRGDVPSDGFVVAASAQYVHVGVECAGEREGRVFLYEGIGSPDDIACWATLGQSLEAVLEWSARLAADSARFGDPFIAVRGRDHGPYVRVNVYDWNDSKRVADLVRPVISEYGGTPAAFGWYDTPDGYIWPGTPAPTVH